MRVIGIDPGTLHAGYGVIEEKNGRLLYLASGCIHAKSPIIAERLKQIYAGLQIAIATYQPQCAAIETVFAGNNIKTAIVIGEARGVALLAAANADLTIANYEPTVVKRAVTGSGRADKEQIRHMVKVLLGLPNLPPTDHEADALGLAITHFRRANAARLQALHA